MRAKDVRMNNPRSIDTLPRKYPTETGVKNTKRKYVVTPFEEKLMQVSELLAIRDISDNYIISLVR